MTETANRSYMSITAKHRDTGEALVVEIDDAFIAKLHDGGREDLVLIAEMLLSHESKIQHERAFMIAVLVAVRDLTDNGRPDVVRAFANTVSSMAMEKFSDEMLGTIGDKGMASAAGSVSELLAGVIQALADPVPAGIPDLATVKIEQEH